MFRKTLLVVVGVIFLFSLAGCASSRRSKDLEMQSLRNQITVLESQVQSKDEEIASLRSNASSMQEAPAAVNIKPVIEVKSRPKAKQIQMALKNAGYYMGAIDGKLGKQSKKAIREFQKANDLPADGKVGKKTWEVLRKYLVAKSK